MKRYQHLAWLPIGLLLTAITACTSDGEGPVFLIGRWQADGEIYVFSSGGKLERLNRDGASTGLGEWSVHGDELSMVIDGSLESVCEFSVDNVRLSVTPSDTCRLAATTLRRVPN